MENPFGDSLKNKIFEKSSHLQLLLFYLRSDIIIQELGTSNQSIEDALDEEDWPRESPLGAAAVYPGMGAFNVQN